MNTNSDYVPHTPNFSRQHGLITLSYCLIKDVKQVSSRTASFTVCSMYWRSSKKPIWVLLFLLLHHCVKIFRIWSFSGSYFPTFELNTFGQSECEKIRTTKTPNTDAMYLRTGRKLNVYKTCRRLPGDLINVQFVPYIQFTSCCRCCT